MLARTKRETRLCESRISHKVVQTPIMTVLLNHVSSRPLATTEKDMLCGLFVIDCPPVPATTVHKQYPKEKESILPPSDECRKG